MQVSQQEAEQQLRVAKFMRLDGYWLFSLGSLLYERKHAVVLALVKLKVILGKYETLQAESC